MLAGRLEEALSSIAPQPAELEGGIRMEQHEFEQRLIEEMADEIATVATSRFRKSLARGDEKLFELHDGERVKLVAVDHYDLGGLLITVEAEDGKRYIVRFEIRSGHYAVEAVPLGEHP
jgi:hypothetical protein